jgi:hypothetical protein
VVVDDDNPAGAIGVTGQSDFNAYGHPSPFPVSGMGAYGPYEMIPEVHRNPRHGLF